MAAEKVQQLGVVTGHREGNAFYGRVSGVVPKAEDRWILQAGNTELLQPWAPMGQCPPAAQSGLAKGTNSKYSALPLPTI